MTLNIDEIDALLEAPLKEKNPRQSSYSPSRRKSRYQDDDNYRSSKPSFSSSRRESSREKHSSSRYSSRKRYSRSRSRSRSRSPSKARDNSGLRRRNPSPLLELTEAQRDRRTVFIQQLAVRLRESELRDFFSKVGRVDQVKIVTDRITGRSKGDETSVPLAILLSGVPIIVSNTESEKNRLAEEAAAMSSRSSSMSSETARAIIPPTTPSAARQVLSEHRSEHKPATSFKRLFVSSIHPDVDEHMLTPIFEAYGRVDSLSLLIDPFSKKSKGAAIVTFRESSAARRAMEQLNGVEIAGKEVRLLFYFKIKITVASDAHMKALADDSEATVSFSITPQSRAELMTRLARESDTVSTNYVLLSNVYDPDVENLNSTTWKEELAEDIQEECSKFGTLLEKPVVLKNIQGEILLQYSDIAASQLSIAALQGRWFGGRQIRASIISSHTFNQKLALLKNSK